MKYNLENRMCHMKYRILLVLTAAIWGFAFVAQIVAMDDIGPFTFNAVRSYIGSLSLLPILFLTRREPSPEKADFPKWLGILIAGIFLCGGTALQQFGLQYTTASKASFITATYILMVPLFGLFLGHILRLNHVIGAVLAMTGVYLLSVTGDFTIGLGDGLVFLCAIFFSAHILYLDYASRRYPPLEIAAGQFLVCGLINTFIAIPVETIHLATIISAWWPILYVGIFSTGIAYTLQIVSQKHLPPTECSMILSLEMVFGGLSGVLALGETMTAKEMAGVLCMTIGVFWSQLPSRDLCRLKGLIKNLSHH